MANNIKGITIEIGGNTGPLNSALKEVSKTSRDLQSELREVNKQLKFDPKNTDLLRQKEDLLKQSTQTLQEKQKTLKTAVEQAHAAFEKGELGADKVRAVEREYEKVNSQLKDTKKELTNTELSVGSFSEKVKARFSSLKDTIKSTFSMENIKTAVGTAGIAVTGFLKGSLDEAKDAQKANADLAQTLKSTKGAAGMTMQSLNDLTQALMNNTTFSDDEIKAGESMLLTFTNIGKNVFPQATAAVLDFAQKMGTDPKNAALTLGKALNDPATGLSKLTKSGVTFTAQQQEQIKAMEKAGNTAGAQKLMIAELNKEFGGQAAAAAQTYDGQQKQLGNTMKEIKETIGTGLMPALANLLKACMPIIQGIANFISKNPQLTAAILAIIAAVSILVGGMSVLNTVMSVFSMVMGASVAPTAAAGAAAGGAAAGFGALLLPITLVVAAIAAVAVGAVLVVKNWSSINNFFIGIWNGIKGAFAGAGDWFKNTFQSAKEGVQSAWSNAGTWFSGIGNNIKNAFNTTIDLIKKNWKSLALFLVNPIAGAVSLLYNNNPQFRAWANNLMNTIKTALVSAWNNIKNFFMQSIPQFIASVGEWFQKLPYNIGIALGTALRACINFSISVKNWITTELPVIINNIVNWFAQLPGRIWAFLVQVVTNIGTWGSNMFNLAKTWVINTINSIGTWFSQLPGRIWTWLLNAISNISKWGSNMYAAASTAVIKTITAIGTWFSQLPGKIWTWLLNVVKSIGTWGNNMNRAASDAITTLINNIVKWFQALPGKMLEIGENIVKGIWNGITSAGSWLWDKVTGWCKDLVNGFKQGLGIHSPSKLFADVIGKNLALGIGQGFSDNMRTVVKSMTAAIPTTWNTGVEVNTAMQAAYGGRVPVSTSKAENQDSAAGNTSSGSGDITVNQYFQGKTPTPSEHARQTKNALRKLALGM